MSLQRVLPVLAAVFFVTRVSPVLAQDVPDGMEVQLPDGRSVMLHDDHPWEFKRPAPQLAAC